MSYSVEFTGSLVERRDVPLCTIGNNIALVTESPSNWYTPSGLPSVADFLEDQTAPDAYLIGSGTGNSTHSWSYIDDYVRRNYGAGNGAIICTPNLTGTYTWTITAKKPSGSSRIRVFKSNGSRLNNVIPSPANLNDTLLVTHNLTTSFVTYSGTEVLSDQALTINLDPEVVGDAHDFKELAIIKVLPSLPPAWDNPSATQQFNPTMELNGSILPDDFVIACPSANPSNRTLDVSYGVDYANIGIDLGGGLGGQPFFVTPNVTGDIQWEIEALNIGSGFFKLDARRSPGSSRAWNTSGSGFFSWTQFSNPTISTGVRTVYGGTIGCSNQFVAIWLEGQFSESTARIYYVRFTLPSGEIITITPSINTQGVAPTGGVTTGEDVNTIQNGQSSIATAVKAFGAKVIHDGAEIVKTTYLPPAENAQDAEITASDSQIITATSNDIAVESEGLGDAERLAAHDTRLLVKKYSNASEK